MKFLYFLILTCIQAWKWSGHYLATRIAYENLLENSPSTLVKIESILKDLEYSNPNMTVYERDHPFVECAAYADWIKYKGGWWQGLWHYVNVPYQDQGDDLHQWKKPAHNSTEAVQAIIDWFNQTEGYN